ncbi:Peroxidase 24 [Linum perenne]
MIMKLTKPSTMITVVFILVVCFSCMVVPCVSLNRVDLKEGIRASAGDQSDVVSPPPISGTQDRVDLKEGIRASAGDQSNVVSPPPTSGTQDCPQLESIVRNITWNRVATDFTLVPKLLRLHFHDCIVAGCDASILLDSTPTNIAEKDAIPNLSVGGYKVIDEIKDAVEKACPGAVSCADILALACRDAVSFETGAHTVGMSRCGALVKRLYNFTGVGDTDPSLSPEYAKVLKTRCSSFEANTTVELDRGSARKFDAHFYEALLQNEGILPSDVTLLTDKQSADMSKAFAGNQDLFFDKFGKSMIKMGDIGMGAGGGEIRKNCRVVN